MPVCSYKITENQREVERRAHEKLAVSSEILRSHPLRYLRPEPLGTRTRLDLMWNHAQLGIRGPSQNGGSFAFYL